MKHTLRALLTMALCLMLALGATACGGGSTDTGGGSTGPDSTPTDVKVGGSVIIGSTTQMSGSDFGTSAWSNNAADADIRTLTNGYQTVQFTKDGQYVWDETVVVKNYTVTENEDGSKTFKITINEGLKYSDGSSITAKDYIGYTLAMASPVALDAELPSVGGTAYVGNEAYNNATEPTPFTGIRLYDDYTFSYQIKATYFPYFYENTYAAFAPYSTALWLGEGVDVKDDGEGAYLTAAWYEKDADGAYKKAEQLTTARYATTERPCSGPYKFVEYNKGANTCKLTINEHYQGNWEGQKPHIKDITYIQTVTSTQMDLFKTGGVDVLSGLSEGNEINAALNLVKGDPDKYAYTNYLRAGYGKLMLVCDYGPTQFLNVRKAVTHLLDKNTFANTFTGGYGSIVHGPYGLSSWMYQQGKEELDERLDTYEFSVTTAEQLLVDDGWVYNADGTAYTSGVRYKKLTAEEAAINGNATYEVSGDTGNYKTVKVGDSYYMPLVLNWCSSEDNPVSDLLVTMLKNAQGTAQVGMVIDQKIMDFSSLLSYMYRQAPYATPTFSMFNLATGFSPIYDYAGYWMTKYSYSNIVYAGVEPCEDATFTEADKDKYSEEEQQAIEGTWNMYMGMGNNVWLADETMDELTWDMVYTATTNEEFLEYWLDYIDRWNELVPEIPLYSNLYHDLYNAKIGGYEVNPDWGVADAMLYCYDKTAQ